MILRWFCALFLLCVLTASAPAQSVIGSGVFGDAKVAAGGCSQATTFVSRASLTGSDATNYTNLICSLVTAGAYSSCDLIYILAAPTATVSHLNLLSTSFTATVTGTPVFTAYRGYADATFGANYLDTGFTPSTNAVNITLNSAYVGIWVGSNVTVGTAAGALDAVPNGLNQYENSFGADKGEVNDGGDIAFTTAAALDWFTLDRSASNARVLARNTVTLTSDAQVSGALPTTHVQLMTQGNSINAGQGNLAAAMFCSHQTSGNQTAIYNALQTYMTAVGSP